MEPDEGRVDLVLSYTELSMLQAAQRTTSESEPKKNLLLIHGDNIVIYNFGFQFMRTTIF